MNDLPGLSPLAPGEQVVACAVCGGITAAQEFGATGELCDVLCLPHLRQLYRNRKAKADREARERAKITCRKCEESGTLYPSGVWCSSCLPPLAERFAVKSSRSTFLEPENLQKIEAEPMLRAVICPLDKTPTGVRSALKLAERFGFTPAVTYAIDANGLSSVMLKAHHPDGRVVTTRHEQPEGRAMGFRAGWYQTTPSAFPVRLGWREVLLALKGQLDPKVYDERAGLLGAMEVCLEAGWDVLRVEAN